MTNETKNTTVVTEETKDSSSMTNESKSGTQAGFGTSKFGTGTFGQTSGTTVTNETKN